MSLAQRSLLLLGSLVPWQVLSTGCRADAYDELVPVNVTLGSQSERVCLPPQHPFRWFWGVEGTEVMLTGQLMPLDEHAVAISAAGREVRLSTIDLLGRSVLRIASGLVDQDNRFVLSFSLPQEVSPGSAQGELRLGLELAHSRVVHEVTAFIRPEYAHETDLLCAYFADEEGELLDMASVGQELTLVVQGYGALPAAPSLDVVVLAPDARVSGLAYHAELPPMRAPVAATHWTVPPESAAETDLALQVWVDDIEGLVLPLDGYFVRSPSLLVFDL